MNPNLPSEIRELLHRHPAGLTAGEIADCLGADIARVAVELRHLNETSTINRQRQPGAYTIHPNRWVVPPRREVTV